MKCRQCGKEITKENAIQIKTRLYACSEKCKQDYEKAAAEITSTSVSKIWDKNGQTYSEAELCAAVLQENAWATILGEASSGRTRTQETVQISDGSAIRLSTGSYVTAKGTDLSRSGGVVPNYIVYNADASAAGTTQGTTGGEDGTASISNDEQLMQALKMLS